MNVQMSDLQKANSLSLFILKPLFLMTFIVILGYV